MTSTSVSADILINHMRAQYFYWSVALTIMLADDAAMLAMIFC